MLTLLLGRPIVADVSVKYPLVASTMHVTTARSIADKTKPKQTPARHTLAKHTIILQKSHTLSVIQASCQRTHVDTCSRVALGASTCTSLQAYNVSMLISKFTTPGFLHGCCKEEVTKE